MPESTKIVKQQQVVLIQLQLAFKFLRQTPVACDCPLLNYVIITLLSVFILLIISAPNKAPALIETLVEIQHIMLLCTFSEDNAA